MAQQKLPFHVAHPLRLKEDRVEEWKMFKQMFEKSSVITKLKETDTSTRKTLLQMKKLKLDEAIDICRSSEITKTQMDMIGDRCSQSIHKV